MMKTKSIFLAMLMLLSFTGLSAQTKKETNKESIVFHVPMDCVSCKNKIEKNIAFEKGVKGLDVSLADQTVEVTYDNRKTDVEKLQAAFKKIGYTATVPGSSSDATKKQEAAPQGDEHVHKEANGNQKK